jgi:hypothetical protein
MNRSTVRRSVALTALAGTAAALLAGTASAGGATPTARDDDGLSSIRNATSRFQDVQVARDSGYVEVSPCESTAEGAMGIHFLHPGLVGDGTVVASQPEVLLYIPSDDGLTLVGVEYFVAEQAAGGRRPSVLGRPFDGPMPGHAPGMPSHYDLHVWAWADNPAGATAVWNPALSC